MLNSIDSTTSPVGGPNRVLAELLDVKQTAALINASQRTVYRLADADKMPRPVKLGALVRWRADELRRWIAQGCPACQRVKGGAK